MHSKFKSTILPIILFLGLIIAGCSSESTQVKQENAQVASGSTTPSSNPSTLPECVKKDCNCSDFKSKEEAQAVLKAFPNDPHNIDKNRDGIACEGLHK